MSRDDLIRFVRRDWAALAQAKKQHWLRWKRSQTPADLWRLADEMRRQAGTAARSERPLADRLADLAVHQRVGQTLRVLIRTQR